MDDIPVQMMQRALEIVSQSPHAINKVAACIWHPDDPTQYVAKTNNWPSALEKNIGRNKKLGNASTTVHAETNMIYAAPFATEGAYACVTEPLCPNCAKNLAEAGMKRIYIDLNGFDKDFFNRRGNEFTEMSMRIFEHAGISVYAIDSDNNIHAILEEINSDYEPPNDHPIHEEQIDEASDVIFERVIEVAREKYKDKKFSVCFAKDKLGKLFCISAASHVVEGFSAQNPDLVEKMLQDQSKYSYIQESLNRTLMHLSRKGYTLLGEFLYCSEVPTSREQVNAVGYGIDRLIIGDKNKSRDDHGLKAMKTLSHHNIIRYL